MHSPVRESRKLTLQPCICMQKYNMISRQKHLQLKERLMKRVIDI